MQADPAPRATMNLWQRIAACLAESALLRRGRSLWAENTRDWELSLSKVDKLRTGIYIILDDYSKGRFPPRFADQQAAYDAEIESRLVPGRTEESALKAELIKPFWNPQGIRMYLSHYMDTVDMLDACGVRPPSRLVELGCGCGWLAELLAIQGYTVLGTTLSPFDVDYAQNRIRSLEAKGINGNLRFAAVPMEGVHTVLGDNEPFDAAYVYEALHHAYDWKKSIDSAWACLKPGGWLMILQEPNLLHTFVAYRVGRLKNTHEIGFSRPQIVRHLRDSGFTEIRIMKHRINTPLSPIWIAARKDPAAPLPAAVAKG